ncbi:Protein of unknown function [Pyronema omphalodes CBS 100304]|uniref:Uncharacterized protein n=1 Tax=Pyronema omphalodes (strain CBS 100304) TaxID=1076935 RepID=U4LDB9_PYROM|nr:Protein of unknown function [Pyronema omphalodes CBS 100304]
MRLDPVELLKQQSLHFNRRDNLQWSILRRRLGLEEQPITDRDCNMPSSSSWSMCAQWVL